MKESAIVTHEQAHALFSYDSASGRLRWKVRANTRMQIGDMVGSHDGDGYLTTKFKGRGYRVHRLVWLMHTGILPTGLIDHINGVRDDNRIENLRDVSSSENVQHRTAPSTNAAGVLGVWRAKRRWKSQIMVKGQIHRLGSFGSPQEAHEAYLKAKERLHFS